MIVRNTYPTKVVLLPELHLTGQLLLLTRLKVFPNHGIASNHVNMACMVESGSMEWISLQCTDLPPRNSHAAVLDGETMVIIGGASPEGQTSDVYTIDLSNRLDLSCQRVCCQPFKSENFSGQRDSGDAPAAREMHSACLYKVDSNEDTGATVLLMGGRSSCGVLREFFSLNTGKGGLF